MTVLTRKTKAASLAMVAIAAFAIAAPQARADLPQGYEQLLYIETYEGGGQCIVTGIRPDLAHKIEMRMRVLKTGDTDHLWMTPLSIVDNRLAYYIVQLDGNKTFSLRYGTLNNYSSVDTDEKFGIVVDGHDYTIVADGQNHTRNFTDETAGVTWSGDMTYTNLITDTTFYDANIPSQYFLLGNANSGNVICRVYSFRITAADGTAVCNYVPARRTSDGAVGLYDTVSDQLIMQYVGGQPFRASPDATIVQTELDAQKGEATLTFNTIPVRMDVVVAWGDKDYGTRLDDWPRNKRCKLGSVAENEVSHTFALPAEALVPGTRIRFFLGDSAQTADYDEEVEWIQPATIGAYIQTDFIPSARPQSETKLNLDNQTYSPDRVTLFDAGTTWANAVWLYAYNDGTIGARHGDYVDFGPFSTTDDLTIGLFPEGNYYYIVVNGDAKQHPYANPDVATEPKAPLSFWRYIHDDYGHTSGNSKYRLYWSKWWNTDKTMLEADIIPVKKDGEYMLFDRVSGKLFTNSGEAGTSFTGGEKVEGSYPMAYFAQLQTSASGVQQIPVPISLTRMDVAFENGSAKLSVSLQWQVAAEEIEIYTTTNLTDANSWQLRNDATVVESGGIYTITIPNAPETLFVSFGKP